MPPANARARRRSGAGRPRRRRACPRAHSRLRLGCEGVRRPRAGADHGRLGRSVEACRGLAELRHVLPRDEVRRAEAVGAPLPRRRSGEARERLVQACDKAVQPPGLLEADTKVIRARLRLGHGVAGLCHGRPETELDAAAYALQAPGKLCCLLAHRRRQLAVVTKRVSELGRQDRAAAARELLDHLCVLQHRFAGDLGRRRRRRATEHEFEALERTALERRAVETANRRQLVQAVDDSIEVNHSASPAASWRCSSSVATEASSTRRPTYTRSTPATESVMSPESTTPLFRTRSTSSSSVTWCLSAWDPASLTDGSTPQERSCTAARAPSPRAARRRGHPRPPRVPPRSVTRRRRDTTR